MAAAAGAVLAYMAETQKDRLGHINDLVWYESGAHLILDEIAKRNLELFSTIVEGKKAGSLFHVLDQTVTSMGARRLRWWLNYPLRDPARIRERLAAVSELREQHLLREDLRGTLRIRLRPGASRQQDRRGARQRPRSCGPPDVARASCRRSADLISQCRSATSDGNPRRDRRDARYPGIDRAGDRRGPAAHDPRGRDHP